MNGIDFVATFPCLEEIDGFLDARLHGLLGDDPEPLSPDEMRAIEDYRSALMKGKVQPAPSIVERNWIYQPKKKPRRKRHAL